MKNVLKNVAKVIGIGATTALSGSFAKASQIKRRNTGEWQSQELEPEKGIKPTQSQPLQSDKQITRN